jgi:hypothetical protein
MKPLVLALSLLAAAFCSAQCPPVDLGRVAEIYGVVRTTGSPVAGAKLSVEIADRKKPPTEITLGPDGHFRFTRLSAGKYILLIHRKGLPDNHYFVQLSPRSSHKPLDITLPIAGVC